ncbi:MAG: hypothetical protein FVQ83_07795 [Chloroflexi bacterium]|nr:hypothetical protein [Chloroflexota bacterium]
MKKFYTSLAGVIIVNIIGLMDYVARALFDFRYVYGEIMPADFDLTLNIAVPNLIIFGIWFWALLAAAYARRWGLIVLSLFNLLFNFGIGLATAILFCPSPCQSLWPIGELINLSNIILGLLVATTTFVYIRKNRKAVQKHNLPVT